MGMKKPSIYSLYEPPTITQIDKRLTAVEEGLMSMMTKCSEMDIIIMKIKETVENYTQNGKM